jgi:hypothetical protein
MRRIVPILSAVAVAAAISIPMMASSSSAQAGPCVPHVLPAPLDIIQYQMDSYSGSLALGNC